MHERTEPACPVLSLAREFEEAARQNSVSEERDFDLRMSEIAEAASYLSPKSKAGAAGAAPWVKPWSTSPGANIPCNAVSNRPYSGCSVVLLWMAQAAGYRAPRFLTFKQALELGGNVRKGERGTKVYFVKQLQVRDQSADDNSSTRLVPMMREYTVFNVDQCENLPDSANTGKPIRVRNPDTRDELADAFLGSTRADIREGPGEACYIPSRDFISMPAFAGFKGADHFYNVAFHELTHYADLRIMPRRCRSREQVRSLSAACRHNRTN